MLNLDFLTELPDVSTPEARTWLNHGDVNTNGPVLDDELLADTTIAGTVTYPPLKTHSHTFNTTLLCNHAISTYFHNH